MRLPNQLLQGFAAATFGTIIVQAQASCSDSFSPLTASAFTASLSPGWNLGNTLDAFPTEGSWNNAPVESSTFDDVKAAGFKSVRIPEVTWAYHFTGSSNEGDSPNWDLDPSWLQRVSDVIDMVTDRGLYVIVNAHHDSALWANVAISGANYTMIEEKFYRLWYQIGTSLGCKASTVAFEPINEPPGSTAEHAAELNKLNNVFLQAINDAGGFNSQRVVTLVGPGEDMARTSQYFERPDPIYTNPYALQVHYYSPYAFTSAAWGKTIWGSDADKQALESDFSLLRNNFTDIPVVIGEWLVSPVMTETAGRWRYYDYLSQMAVKYNFATIIWDSGADHLDRAAHAWHDPTSLSVHANALMSISNSLPDATTDSSLTTQFTSAYIFHRLGSTVQDYDLLFKLNGNSVSSITDGSTTLSAGTQYYLEGDNITISASYLSDYFASSATGVLGTLIITFSAGTAIPVQILQWDVPVATTTSAKAIAGNDTAVSITWKGLGKPATVSAYKSDGSFLVDDWTIYLGPLEQGRTTFGGQWNFAWNQAGVTITGTAASAVVAANQSTTFVVEAYPRVAGNSANFTLTV
ncbi:hypothetical protein PFICI_10979 [Pestalotiopsis fici W106-1]|uniref:Glycoside hydrolase family 5 domain-containing protein n=1 Tax=Pestalotiopsis fici (strain W106-1 / CGMCC3.15140) TaxID=1229662 RepID=W3WTC8_PESFW|nr:uncharacterized protein PFICI_10979 [Pestalotiopsis fici W106-1]ETS77105.1 hypothetical protein PFICI_10979 [Pestalotiopsis fici W106-1]